MGCPFHESDGEADEDRPAAVRGPDEQGVDRREFTKSALVIGGTNALATAVGLYGMPDTAAAEPVGVAQRNDRQHAWDAFEAETRGTTVPPAHHLILLADYGGSGEPPPGHRKQRRALSGTWRRPSSRVTGACCSP